MSKRIEELEKRKEQIEQQLRDARARELKKKRKIETRFKIILGSLILRDALNDSNFWNELLTMASERDSKYLKDYKDLVEGMNQWPLLRKIQEKEEPL